MPRTRLTAKAVAKLRAPTSSKKQEIFWDSDVRGFGVLLSGTTAAKSYIVQRDLSGSRTRRVTIASVYELSLAAARERACEILVDMRRGIDPKRRNSGTLQQTLAAYLQTNKDLSETTRTLYAALVERHLAAWKDRTLATISPAECDAMHAAIAAKVRARGRYDGGTIANQVMAMFRGLYNFASNRADDMPRNPVRIRQSEWHKVAPTRRPIPADKLAIFHAAVCRLPNKLGRDYLLLLLYTGMRRREAAALTWSEIDFATRTISLAAPRTKSGRPLVLPMSDIVANLLIERRRLGDAKFVFPSNSARSGFIQDARPWVDATTKATGIKFCLHDLRRSFTTIAESCDIAHFALRSLINHSLGSSVTAGYVEMTADRLREPVQRVANRIKGLCGISAPKGDKVAALR